MDAGTKLQISGAIIAFFSFLSLLLGIGMYLDGLYRPSTPPIPRHEQAEPGTFFDKDGHDTSYKHRKPIQGYNHGSIDFLAPGETMTIRVTTIITDDLNKAKP